MTDFKSQPHLLGPNDCRNWGHGSIITIDAFGKTNGTADAPRPDRFVVFYYRFRWVCLHKTSAAVPYWINAMIDIDKKKICLDIIVGGKGGIYLVFEIILIDSDRNQPLINTTDNRSIINV